MVQQKWYYKGNKAVKIKHNSLQVLSSDGGGDEMFKTFLWYQMNQYAALHIWEIILFMRKWMIQVRLSLRWWMLGSPMNKIAMSGILSIIVTTIVLGYFTCWKMPVLIPVVDDVTLNVVQYKEIQELFVSIT